jgi:ABC-type dipeptide/oligopeptide/nickel transport system permease subunit
VAERIPFWMRAVFFAALGLLIAAILPEWGWTVFVVVVVVTYWTGVWRRNRRQTGSRPASRP